MYCDEASITVTDDPQLDAERMLGARLRIVKFADQHGAEEVWVIVLLVDG